MSVSLYQIKGVYGHNVAAAIRWLSYQTRWLRLPRGRPCGTTEACDSQARVVIGRLGVARRGGLYEI